MKRFASQYFCIIFAALLSVALQSISSISTPSIMAQSGNQKIINFVAAGGGGTSAGGNTGVAGTAGQPVAGVSTSGQFTVLGGFWSGAATALVEPLFRELSIPTITYGTPSVIISGKIGTDQFTPPITDTVSITLNGVARHAAIQSNGLFSATFDTHALPVSGSPYTVSFSYAGNQSFAPASANGALSVNKAPLTVKADDKVKSYGAALPVLTVSYFGFVSGENQSVLTGTLGFISSVAENSPVGTYLITPTGLTSNNYHIAYVPGTLTVAKAALIVTADDKSKVFGAPLPALTASFSGFVLGQNQFNLGGSLSLSTTATAASDVGSYPITVSGLTSSNYSISFVPGTLTVTAAASSLSVSSAGGSFAGTTALTATLTGGGAPVSGKTVSFSVNGQQRGDAVTNGNGVATLSSVSLSGINAGNYPAGITASFAGDKNLSSSSGSAQLSVNKLVPIITWSNPSDIVFGTALSSSQLNANASVPGTFSYNPPGGTVLNAGNGQLLQTSFTPGDTINYDNATAGVQINVLKAGQTISFSAIADKALGNAPFAVSATASSGLPVSFTVVSGPATISGNTVTVTGAGAVTIRASQPGDNNYHPATSVDRSFTVSKGVPVISWNNPADIVYGTALSSAQLNASASVAGTLSYNPPAGAVLNAGNGQVLQVTLTPSDSTNYNTATASVQINVLKANQTISFAAIGNKTVLETPVTLTATASSGLPVSFSLVSGPATVSGNQLSLTGAGTVVVQATQSGNDNYNVAPSVTQSFAVIKLDQAITFGPLTDKTYGDAPFTISATAGSGLPVSFSVVSGPASISGNTVTITGAGIVMIKAEQAGNEKFNPAPGVTRTLAVAKANQTITMAAIANKKLGDAPLTVSATASSGLPVTLSITSGPATISGNTVTITGIGMVTIKAEQSGNENFNPAASVSQSFTVSKAASSVILSSSLNPSSLGQAVTFTAQVSGPAGILAPTGTVLFKDGSAVMGSSSLNSSGQASISTATLVVGGHSITAQYSGDSRLDASVSSSLAQIVNQAASSVTLNSSINPSVFGQSVVFTVVVSGPAGTVTPSGTVVFKDGATTIGTKILDSSGQATLVTSTLTVGTHPITARYSGDSNFNPSTSVALTQAVGQGATVTTGSDAQASYSDADQAIQLTATIVSSPASVVLSPLYVLRSGWKDLTSNADGRRTLDVGQTTSSEVNQGTVSCTVRNISGQAIGSSVASTVSNSRATMVWMLPGGTLPGTYTIEYSFSGAGGFAPSSDIKALTVNKAATAVTVSNHQIFSINATQSITLTATVTGSVINEGTVVFQIKDGAANIGSSVSAPVSNGAATAVYILPASIAARNYTITVSYSGSNKHFASSGNGSLTVIADKASPALSITSPANLSLLNGSTVTVTGTVSDAESGVDSVKVNDVTATVSGELFTATLSGLSTGPLTIRVVATDRAGNISTSEIGVTIGNTAPTISLLSPIQGFSKEGKPIPAVLVAGSTVKVTFQITDGGSGIDESSVEINDKPAVRGQDGNYSIELADMKAGTVAVKVEARDQLGNVRTEEVVFIVVIRGDVNANGRVDTNDLILLIQILQGVEMREAGPGADINADGKTDLNDLIMLIQILQGN